MTVQPRDHNPTPGRPGLPIPRTSFVGRERAIADLKRLLAAHRLVTISGSGGGGKTRLALRVAEELLPEYPDGVWWVDLAVLSDAALLPQTVAAALGLREHPGSTPAELILQQLSGRRALLILDNCEHLRPACAELLNELSPGSGTAGVLVTSREPLRAHGEHVWQLPLLDVPADRQGTPLEQLAGVESVRLFVERARTVAPLWSLHERNVEAVTLICRRLEGLPLAIELAAARCTVLTAAEIAERLENSVGLLTRAAHGSDARHIMLRAAIDWSFQLLERGEQALFVRLAVFSGSFDLRAVEDVCAGSGLGRGELLDTLALLVEKSLVVAAQHDEQMRYRLLEPIRHYAVELLAGDPQQTHWRRKHAAYYLALAEHAASKLSSSEQLRRLEQLDREHDNALAALSWCAASRHIDIGLRLASVLHRYWLLRGLLSLGRRRLAELIAQVDDTIEPEVQSRAWTGHGRLLAAQSDFPASRASYEQALVMAQHSEDEACIETALIGLGATLLDLGDFAAARATLEQAVEICRAAGHTSTLARAYGNLGLVHQYGGTANEARAYYEQAVANARASGNYSVAAITLMNFATLASHGGEYAEAARRYREAIEAHSELGDRSSMADTLLNLGQLHVELNELSAAEECFARAEQIYLAQNNWGDQAYIEAGRGDLEFYRERYEQAQTHYQQALKLFQAAGNQRLIGRSLGFLGYIAVRQGRLKDAAGLCAEALAVRRAIGHRAGLIFSLDRGYIELALAVGRPAVAARLMGGVEAARELLGRPRTPVEAAAASAIKDTLRSQLGGENWLTALNEGRAMDLDQAVAYAHDSLSRSAIEQPAPELRIFALGPVRVYRGDRLLTSTDWTYAKARELIVLLLFRPHATREQIGAELWPDASTEQVRQRFSAALAHARTALGRDSEWITLAEGRYSFNRVRPVWVDVDAFEAGLFEAQLLLQGRQEQRAAGVLAEAVALYSSDFAGDIHDGEWHIARREALRHALLEALLQLGVLHGKAGRSEQAIAVLQRAVDTDVFFEEAHHELIRAYARAGKRRQAFAQYHKLQSALVELHAVPSAETSALIQSLQHGDPL